MLLDRNQHAASAHHDLYGVTSTDASMNVRQTIDDIIAYLAFSAFRIFVRIPGEEEIHLHQSDSHLRPFYIWASAWNSRLGID